MRKNQFLHCIGPSLKWAYGVPKFLEPAFALAVCDFTGVDVAQTQISDLIAIHLVLTGDVDLAHRPPQDDVLYFTYIGRTAHALDDQVAVGQYINDADGEGGGNIVTVGY